MVLAFWLTTKTVAVALLSTVFATTAQNSLHRSALFLLFFLIVHMAGNLTALFGRDAYNMYGHHLNSTPGIRLIELYLAVGTVVHIITAAKATWEKKKYVAKSPMQSGLLALTGTVLLVFFILHLKAVRFSSSTRRWRDPSAPESSATDRDLYFIMLELFHSPAQVALYVASVAALGFH